MKTLNTHRQALTGLALTGLLLQAAAGTTQAATSRTLTPPQARAAAQYGRLPLSFEQGSKQVPFISRGHGYQLALTPGEAVVALSSKHQADAVMRMRLVGANRNAQSTGQDQLPGVVNDFTARNPGQWRVGVPTFGKVACRGVYPGVDLIYYGNQRHLEYDFRVGAGADPHQIALDFGGAKSLNVGKGGELNVQLPNGQTVQWHAPVVYQTLGGKKWTVTGRYAVSGSGVRFRLGAYDRTQPLVIDPMLAYNTYLGGSNSDSATGIAVDASGCAYITGDTGSVNFPTNVGTRTGTYSEAYVTKLNAAGTAIVYSTYLGGTGDDYGMGIAVDSSGSAYVTGETWSSDFPTTPGAYSRTFGGLIDGFVTKLTPVGTIAYSTYLFTSPGSDYGYGIAVDAAGDAYVAGKVEINGGNWHAEVAKLNPTGTGLLYNTALNGTGIAEAKAIAIDATGNAYVTGDIYGTGLSVTAPAGFRPYQSASRGDYDAFVAKLGVTGNLTYNTYLGGSGSDGGLGIATDASGSAYVSGGTFSANFPTTLGAYDRTFGGNEDGFVAKVNPTGSALTYSTYLDDGAGGTGYGSANAIALDPSGSVFVTGNVYIDAYYYNIAYVTQLNASGSAELSTVYVYGTGTQAGKGLARGADGSVYVAGYTTSTNLNTVTGSFDTSADGSFDGFTARIVYTDPTATISSLSPGSAWAGGTSNLTLTVTGSSFLNGYSEAYWNGTPLATTFVSPGVLTATVPASLLASAGSFPVTVRNTYGTTTTSNSVSFTLRHRIIFPIHPIGVNPVSTQ